MSTTAWKVVELAVLVALVIGLVVFSRRKGGAQRSKARLKGFGMSIDAESSSEITPGVGIHDATSVEGGLIASDQTGRGLDVKKIQTSGRQGDEADDGRSEWGGGASEGGGGANGCGGVGSEVGRGDSESSRSAVNPAASAVLPV